MIGEQIGNQAGSIEIQNASEISVPKRDLRVLLEMRPAFDGYSGIPQETRLLFRGLSLLDGVSVEGLLQHAGRVLPVGLSRPSDQRLDRKTRDRDLNRLGRIVIVLEQNYWDSILRSYGYTFAMAV